MTGFSSANWVFLRALAVVAGATLLTVPLAATPIATGSDGLSVFSPGNGSLTYQVVTNNGGAGITSQGFVPGGNPATFASTVTGSMTLDNILSPGYTVNSATLDLTVLSSLTAGSVSTFYNCTGSGDCAAYVHDHPTITPNAPAAQVAITVISTSGTTYTWNYQVSSSSPFQLNLATANPDFLTDLSNGQDLSISWTQTQTFQLTGSYATPTGQNKCKNCTLTFHYDGLSRSTTVQASVNGTVTGPLDPPDPTNPVPEPSTGLLLGLGLIATTATLRRKFFPR